MTDQDSKSHWQDWTTFGLRWVFLIGMSLAVFITRSQAQTTEDIVFNDIATAFGIGVAITLIIGACAYIASIRPALLYVLVLGDWALAIVYVLLIEANDIVLLIAVMSFLSISGVLRVGANWGIVHVGGVIIAAMGAIIYQNYDLLGNFDFINDDPLGFFEPYLVPLLVVILATSSIGIWLSVQNERTSGQHAALSRVVSSRSKQVEDMRERARALSEMTQTLNGTLRFDKILDATLDIGRFSLQSSSKQRVVGMVMLFRSDGETLYIVNSRGLNHIDEHRKIYGEEGIVNDALTQTVSVIGKDPFRDPELKSFNAFQGMRSILVIPLRAHYDNYGVLIFASSGANAFNEDVTDTLNAISVQATVALQNAVLYNSLMEEKERILQMEGDARKALVRDLHDIPTQTVSAVAMRIRIIIRLLEKNPSEIPSELAQVEQMAVRATEELRHVLFKLRPLALESQGLKAALDQLADKLQKTYKQNVAVRVQPDAEHFLDETKQGALFYLIEEAVNNARKYAQAKLIKVTIDRRDGELVIRIRDNGVGFDTKAVDDGYDERGSFGMVNMRERAEMIDGTLTLKSVVGKGTEITVIIPIEDTIQARERATHLRSQMPDTKLAKTAMASLSQMQY